MKRKKGNALPWSCSRRIAEEGSRIHHVVSNSGRHGVALEKLVAIVTEAFSMYWFVPGDVTLLPSLGIEVSLMPDFLPMEGTANIWCWANLALLFGQLYL